MCPILRSPTSDCRDRKNMSQDLASEPNTTFRNRGANNSATTIENCHPQTYRSGKTRRNTCIIGGCKLITVKRMRQRRGEGNGRRSKNSANDGIKQSVSNTVQYTRNSSRTIRSRMRIHLPKVMNYIAASNEFEYTTLYSCNILIHNHSFWNKSDLM